MVVIVFGVAGAGKTTIAQLLAERLGWKFYDADDFHPPANIAKLRAGIALSDTDRQPWLELIRNIVERDVDSVIACSALKQKYRAYLAADAPVCFVYLRIARSVAEVRLANRTAHFMNPGLLADQFRTLEEPTDATTITVEAAGDPGTIVRDVTHRLRNRSSGQLETGNVISDE